MSSRSSRCPFLWSRLTWEPSRWNASANSHPMAPPPITATLPRPCLVRIESGARATDDGFGGNATPAGPAPAQKILLNERDLRPKSRRPGRGHQPSRPCADHDEIVAGRRGRVPPIRGMKIRDESRIVRVSRPDQDGFRGSAHHIFGVCSVSLLPIFFANAFQARRATNTVTVTVASSPTPYKTHSPVVRWRWPAPTLPSEPR